MGKNNILIINSRSGLNGSGISLYNLVKELDTNQYRATVLLPEPGPLAGVLCKYCNVHFLKMRLIEKSFKGVINYVLYFVPTLIRLSGFINKNKYNIIHVNTITNLYGGIASYLTNVKVLYHIREVPGFYPKVLWMLYRFNLLLFSNSIVACSNIVARLLHINNRQIYTVFNGVDINIFKESRHDDENTDITIGTFANESRRKGLIYLLEAFVILKKRFKRIKLSVISSRPIYSNNRGRKILDFINEYSLENDVTFTGLTLNVIKYLQGISILVVPSLYEAFPRSVIEGLSMSLPVIATNTGGTSEVIIHDKTGLLIPPKDVEKLVECIEVLIEDKRYAEELGNNGRDMIENKFRCDITARDIESIYDKLGD